MQRDSKDASKWLKRAMKAWVEARHESVLAFHSFQMIK